MLPNPDSPDFSCSTRIDLWDETLREGAERSPLSPSVEEKVELAIALGEIGIRSIVVGMFPDVPHNAELLRALLDAQEKGWIGDEVKFVVISHLGSTLDESIALLAGIERLSSVWLLGIHGVSDLHIEHLHPVIREKETTSDFDYERWARLSPEERRAESSSWLEGEAIRLLSFEGGGAAVGLLDAFRTRADDLAEAASCCERVGVRHIRLVDTAGTCIPEQIETHIRPLVTAHPDVRFYGHFHNDFGLAAGNAVLGLAAGLVGADVSVGGFANRAGHPALAEVTMALKLLYGIQLPDFDYTRLFRLSRAAERVYGLMESPTQPITGVITHGVLSGIRTQLISRAPTIFDLVDPAEVGTERDRVFGVRSGVDGMRRFLKENAGGLQRDENELVEMAEEVFDRVIVEWQARSDRAGKDLDAAIAEYHRVLKGSAAFTEREMLEMIEAEMVGSR